MCAVTCSSPKRAEAVSAELTLGMGSISFPAADPDVAPVVAALENPVHVKVKVRGDKGVPVVAQLTALAGGDLISGPDRIAIEQVSWSGAGSGFLSGVFSATESQLVGQWSGDITVNGDLRFWLANSWTYASGEYSQTVVYTLVAY